MASIVSARPSVEKLPLPAPPDTVNFEMRHLLPQLFTALDAGRKAAVCRLVETRGSTPQKAGAAMLVFADGLQAGTLGGGCVEAEVKRRAIAAMASGTRTIERFQLDDNYGWDDGLICGGRMTVHIDCVTDPEARHYYATMAKMIEQRRGFTEAIVFDNQASQLISADSFLFDDKTQLIDQRSNSGRSGIAPNQIVSMLKPIDERPRPSAQQGIAILPTLARCRLLIVGGGHVGQAVARLAAELEFSVWIVDDRPEYITAERFPNAEQRLAGPITDVLPQLEITPDTYCLIVTRGHNHDEQALFHLVNRGACYVGMIGSKRKIRLIFDDLLAEGISAETLARVHAPVGIDIGSQTVMEIAVSIAAQLVAHRNRGEVGARDYA
jgi:xanthine dehydrogenase accessory factor